MSQILIERTKKTDKKKKNVIIISQIHPNSEYLYFGSFSKFSNIKNNTKIPTVDLENSWTCFHMLFLESLYSSYIPLVIMSITHTTSFFICQNWVPNVISNTLSGCKYMLFFIKRLLFCYNKHIWLLPSNDNIWG